MFRKVCSKVTRQIARNHPFRKRMPISISTEILIDIFLCFSRKGLCQQVYRVNRQFYRLATSKNCVPVIHLITKELHFFSAENQQNISVGRRYFVPWYDKDNQVTHSMPSNKFLKKMPCPDQFVRFEKVTICRYLEEDEIKFLLTSRESFVECELEGGIQQSTLPFVSICTLLETNALLNCNKLELYSNELSEETVCMLLDWLKGSGNRNSLSVGVKKHLILSRYPIQSIIPMIHRLKKDFETVSMPCVEFVITLLICPSEWSENKNLDGYEFSLDTNGTRLYLFPDDEYKTCFHEVYRLWQRRFLNEANDNAMLSYIRNIPRENSRHHEKSHRNPVNKYELYSYDGLVFFG
ncbi:hypothetical protein DdX_16493 [Ditylenchus destructor]|uniref:F-box domain-containing protein n=1 Tax=Ditylenchus destructor TaxID=166010 RepID=A0AAD4MQA1_9BILA|nr:hypothetical protein DdX_16493 [Ditylenchus destructor]